MASLLPPVRALLATWLLNRMNFVAKENAAPIVATLGKCRAFRNLIKYTRVNGITFLNAIVSGLPASKQMRSGRKSLSISAGQDLFMA